MTLREAMKRADALRDNLLDDQQKAAWLEELDGQLAEFMEVDLPTQTWPEDRELLMPAPHDGFYVYYLMAMIDYMHGESTMYFNDMTLYNSALDDAKAWWLRNHRPKDKGGWGV